MTTEISNEPVALTGEQARAAELINRRILDDRADFVLGGLAGTGKTTLIRHLYDEWTHRGLDPLVVAPTAKAAYRLSQNDVEAFTIHHWLYQFIRNERDAKGRLQPVFMRKGSPKRPRLVICDEASMVGDRIYREIRQQQIPTLFALDPGQLPPVRAADPGLVPDFLLTEIHRQAKGSPIIALAHAIRSGTGDIYQPREGIDVYPMASVQGIVGTFFDQAIDHLIVHSNATRIAINQAIQERRHPGSRQMLHPGDVIIAIANDSAAGVLNGQCLLVERVGHIGGAAIRVDVRPEEGGELRTIDVAKAQFNRADRITDRPGGIILADYGWAITCHRAQGSQWDHVGVVPPAWRSMPDLAKWEYTAVTRAAKRVSIFQAVQR